MTSQQVIAVLRRRYPKQEWAFLEQVSNGTGAGAGRWADAIAMNLWPSRGLKVHGFEVKVSKGDLKRELENPAKAEAIAQFCDFWWIVAGSENVVQGLEHDIPPTWGIMVVRDDDVFIVRAAPPLEEPKPVNRSFVAAVLRRAQEQVTDDVRVEQLVRKARNDGYKEGEKSSQKSVEAARSNLQSLENMLTKFGIIYGDHLGYYNVERIAHEARAGRALGVDKLRTMQAGLTAALEGVNAMLEATNDQSR